MASYSTHLNRSVEKYSCMDPPVIACLALSLHLPCAVSRPSPLSQLIGPRWNLSLGPWLPWLTSSHVTCVWPGVEKI